MANNDWVDVQDNEWQDVQPSMIQKIAQKLQPSANVAIQTMQKLPLAKQYLDLEQNQAQQRGVIQNALYNKMGSRFPVARGIAAEALNYATPSNIIAGGLMGYGAGQGLQRMALNPATRRFLQLRTPTLAKGVLEANPLQPQYKDVGGRMVDITEPLPPTTYASNKVLAIRNSAKTYHNTEVKAYGDMLETLAKTGKEKIDVTPALETITKMMKEKGLISPEGKWLTPLNKVDGQLVKSYESLLREIQTAGTNKIDTSKVIQEIINIKNSGGSFKEPTTFGRMALEAQGEVLSSIKPQIKSNIFTQANKRYTLFKQKMDALDTKFNIWGNPMQTGTGERFLMRQLETSGEAKNIANIVKQNLGQTLKGAKTASKLYQLQRNPLVRWGGLGLLGGYGLSRMGGGQR